MFKIFKTILLIIWLIDILNINCVINGIQIAEFLDTTVPINTLFWLLLWILIPSSSRINIKTEKEEK